MKESLTDHKELSRGCQLCQQGKWLCIFLTYKCNAHCHFCPAPFTDDQIRSEYGNQKEKIISYLYHNDFNGISFSGGDPFIVYDRLLDWLTYFKKRLPHYYYWVYTNGLAVDRAKLARLVEEGMDEIRFNIAATGYLSDEIFERIKIARELFPFVSIEIPSIKQDYGMLVKALPKLDRIGVDYLNLHDLILMESDYRSSHEPAEAFLLNKTMPVRYAISSLQNTKDIIDLATSKGFRFKINHCSMQKKELQMNQRDLKMTGMDQ